MHMPIYLMVLLIRLFVSKTTIYKALQMLPLWIMGIINVYILYS